VNNKVDNDSIEYCGLKENIGRRWILDGRSPSIDVPPLLWQALWLLILQLHLDDTADPKDPHFRLPVSCQALDWRYMSFFASESESHSNSPTNKRYALVLNLRRIFT